MASNYAALCKKARYFVTKGGKSCIHEGGKALVTPEECERAATAMRLKVQHITESGAFAHLPLGCAIRNDLDDHLIWSSNRDELRIRDSGDSSSDWRYRGRGSTVSSSNSQDC